MPLNLARDFPLTQRVLQQIGAAMQEAWAAMPWTGLVRPAPVSMTRQGAQLRVTIPAPSVTGMELGQGRQAYHLPSRIRWAQSRAAKRNKQGRWYLRVPFSHEGFTRPHPLSSYARSVMFADTRRQLSAETSQVARQLRLGQRLTAGLTRGRAVHAPGLTQHQEGLQRSRRGGRGSLLTFRTITPDSQGWWIPARPARPEAPQAQHETAPQVHDLLEEAARQDLDVLMQAALRGVAR